MQNYITTSVLTINEGLGSQMSNFAALYAIAKKTGHRILFMEGRSGGKGLLLNAPFEGLPIDVVSEGSLIGEEGLVSRFQLDVNSVVDSRVFEISSNINYDFDQLFHSYRYWYPARDEILGLFRFKKEIVAQALALLGGINADGREIVSIHVRRTNYLTSLEHANLSLDYYLNACSQFIGDKYVFLVFSDDIEWCRATFKRRANFFYSGKDSAHVDLCAMSLCHHNIVANSSFSMWGALLNRSRSKKVVCPSRYLKEDAMIRYINHAWFPDDWICLDDLLA